MLKISVKIDIYQSLTKEDKKKEEADVTKTG